MSSARLGSLPGHRRATPTLLAGIPPAAEGLIPMRCALSLASLSLRKQMPGLMPNRERQKPALDFRTGCFTCEIRCVVRKVQMCACSPLFRCKTSARSTQSHKRRMLRTFQEAVVGFQRH